MRIECERMYTHVYNSQPANIHIERDVDTSDGGGDCTDTRAFILLTIRMTMVMRPLPEGFSAHNAIPLVTDNGPRKLRDARYPRRSRTQIPPPFSWPPLACFLSSFSFFFYFYFITSCPATMWFSTVTPEPRLAVMVSGRIGRISDRPCPQIGKAKTMWYNGYRLAEKFPSKTIDLYCGFAVFDKWSTFLVCSNDTEFIPS